MLSFYALKQKTMNKYSSFSKFKNNVRNLIPIYIFNFVPYFYILFYFTVNCLTSANVH